MSRAVNSQLCSSSREFVQAAFPGDFTPQRIERIDAAVRASNTLGPLVENELGLLSPARDIKVAAIVPLGVHATRQGLFSIINTDSVQPGDAESIAQEVSRVCIKLDEERPVAQADTERLGLIAELGILNMAWQGIADGGLDISYAFLLGERGANGRRDNGMRADVDMLTSRKQGVFKPKSVNQKIQIKASRHKEDDVYDDGIITISAEGLVGKRRREAIKRLIRWDRAADDTKDKVYANFMHKLRSRK